jgi:hypothetical protein
MFTSRIVTAAALMVAFATARAESPIPANFVDDFGVVGVQGFASAPAHSSSIIGENYVDDFGVGGAQGLATIPTATAFIPGNYVDNFDVAAGIDAPEQPRARVAHGPGPQ